MGLKYRGNMSTWESQRIVRRMPKLRKRVTVILVQSIHRSNPEVPIRIPDDRSDGALREPVRRSKLSEMIRLELSLTDEGSDEEQGKCSY